MGEFDKAFLAVPGECLMTSDEAAPEVLFAAKTRETKKLANKFLAVSNLTPKDKGLAITEGNEKVIRARLSDAKFFWDQDLKRRLEPMHFELKGITFHEKLGHASGTAWSASRSWRARSRARSMRSRSLAGRAAQLCKADLVSGMVGEFPELQGLMGRYYAEAEHMNPKIAHAIEEHYKPKGQSRQRADGAGVDRRGVGGQARYAGRLLGHQRKADGQRRSLSAPARRAGCDPDRAGE